MNTHNKNSKEKEKKTFSKIGYSDALEKAMTVRLERQQLYGDSWKENSDWELLAQIKNKVGRLENRIINKKSSYENEIDCLVDLINYSLFLLQNKLENKK